MPMDRNFRVINGGKSEENQGLIGRTRYDLNLMASKARDMMNARRGREAEWKKLAREPLKPAQEITPKQKIAELKAKVRRLNRVRTGAALAAAGSASVSLYAAWKNNITISTDGIGILGPIGAFVAFKAHDRINVLNEKKKELRRKATLTFEQRKTQPGTHVKLIQHETQFSPFKPSGRFDWPKDE